MADFRSVFLHGRIADWSFGEPKRRRRRRFADGCGETFDFNFQREDSRNELHSGAQNSAPEQERKHQRSSLFLLFEVGSRFFGIQALSSLKLVACLSRRISVEFLRELTLTLSQILVENLRTAEQERAEGRGWTALIGIGRTLSLGKPEKLVFPSHPTQMNKQATLSVRLPVNQAPSQPLNFPRAEGLRIGRRSEWKKSRKPVSSTTASGVKGGLRFEDKRSPKCPPTQSTVV